jgi:hypothetical protein
VSSARGKPTFLSLAVTSRFVPPGVPGLWRLPTMCASGRAASFLVASLVFEFFLEYRGPVHVEVLCRVVKSLRHKRYMSSCLARTRIVPSTRDSEYTHETASRIISMRP